MNRFEMQIIFSAKTWRKSKCVRRVGNQVCDGDNHMESCPVELARQDLIAAVDAEELHG